MEEFIKNIFSIIVLNKDYLVLKKQGSFFISNDLKKSCDIDIKQISKKEKLNSLLIELATHLVEKEKEYSNLIIKNIELDTIVDERIEIILNSMDKFNLKLGHILEFEKKEFPKLNITISKSLPKDIIKNIENLIDNYNNNNKLFELFKLHSYLKSIQKLRVLPHDILNNNLYLNGRKINLNDYVISKITINIIFENKPVSNIIIYKTNQSEIYFKFSKLYSSIENTIYYYNLLKNLRLYLIVGYYRKIFPKNIAVLIPDLRDKIIKFKETLSVYSYKLCKYETLMDTQPEKKELYYKKYLKYYNRINNKSKEFFDNLANNKIIYNYLLENIEIRL